MPSDVESKLRDLGREWNATIPHVGVDEVIGGRAPDGTLEWEINNRQPVSDNRSRLGWAVSAAAVLVVAMVASLAWFVGAPDTDPAATSPAAQAPPELAESPLAPGIAVADATVSGRGFDADGGTFEIDKGSVDGIEIGMPVVNAAGLVGRVASVDDATSVVLSATSPDFVIEATVSSAQADSVEWPFAARGDGGSMMLSDESSTIDVASVQIGDLVETSGSEGSIAPPGVPIGTVTSVRSGSSQLVIDLYSSGETPSFVRVLLYRPLSDASAPIAPSGPLLDDLDDPQSTQEPEEMSESHTAPDVSDPGRGLVLIANANTIGGSAGTLSRRLEMVGFNLLEPANSTIANLAESIIYANDPNQCLAAQLGDILGIDTVAPMPDPLPVDDTRSYDQPAVMIALGDDIATSLQDDLGRETTAIECPDAAD